ncbi:hypothetical protein [Streptomyces sp. NPDC008125]
MRKKLAGLVGILTAAVLLFGIGATAPSAGHENRAADMGPTSAGA